MKLPKKDIQFKNLHILIFYLITTILIALFVYKDYGVSWDEDVQRKTAKLNFDYIFRGDKSLKTWKDRDYGVAFELPLVILEKAFKWEKPNGDETNVYYNRHFFTHLFYLFGGVFLYLLVVQLFKSKLYGILSLLLYVLNPRIYAHSYINSKDIPLMIMFIMCFYFFIRFVKKRSLKNIFILSFVSAILINVRIVGVIFPVMTIFYLLIFDFVDFRFKNYKKTLHNLGTYIFSTSILVYSFWPNLWLNPFSNFIASFVNMSHFRHDSYVLTFGEMIKASSDKSYFFKWFFTTNPLLYIILGCLGLLLMLFCVLKSKGNFLLKKQNRYIAFISSFMVASLIIIIGRGSVLYNGWRQLFFVYPSFIILVLFSMYFFKHKKIHKYIILAFVFYAVFVCYSQIKIHPYQTVYFNEIITSKKNYRAENFELDYWGHSYKEAILNLISFDKSPKIKVAFSEKIGMANVKMLNLKDKQRIVYEKDVNEADYFIARIYKDYLKFKDYKPIFEVRRNNSVVISIFKLK